MTPTASGEHDDRRRVPGGEAIDELLHRRAFGLRLLHQVDDARQRRVVAAPGDGDDQRAMPVDGAGEDLVARRLLHRHRLTGDRRLVDVGASVGDGAVEREALAGAHVHHLTGQHPIERHQPFDAVILDAGLDRREIQQRPDGGARAIDALRLEPLRHREEEDHDRGFLPFANHQRPADRDHHQRVDVEHPAPQRAPGAAGRKHRAGDDGDQEQRLGPRRRAADQFG